MLSSAHGPLQHLLLCFPKEAALRDGYRRAYGELVARLPSYTRLTAIVDPAARETLEELLAGRPAQLIATEEGLDFSVWAQDPLVVVEDGDGPALLCPCYFRRGEDAEVPRLLSEALGWPLRQSQLYFHGGYLLAADDFVLIGRDCLDATIANGEFAQPDEVRQRFAEELGRDRRLIFVGTDLPVPKEELRPAVIDGVERLEHIHNCAGTKLPVWHLDVFISLAGRGADGRYRLLVGSPALADEMLGRRSPDHALPHHFDDIADQLSAEGFDVIRTPLPLTYGDGRRKVDGEVWEVRVWYFASANNCLVQIDAADGNHVWLPSYGHGAWRELAPIDDMHRHIWESLGFTVHQLTSYHALAQRQGAVHCIAKELSRGCR